MSADNGVYVLPVLDRQNEQHYRVAHVQAVEDVFRDSTVSAPDKEQGAYDENCLRVIFGDAPKFRTLPEAESFAKNFLREIEANSLYPVEYGVVVLPAFEGRL